MADRSGQQLGNYRLTRLLGQGGFSEVYLGEHIHLGTQAAIKVLLARMANEDIEKFRREAQTIARLSHSHIVRVLDFDVQDGVAFLVMDYAPGGTLRQRHPPGMPLAPLAISPYIKQIAEALQYAHEQGVVHRDIKPENMLLGPKNEVLLSDFGIAFVTQGSRYETNKDVAGTVAYMAPEQIAGHPRPASDQYALGVVVYEWLTGARPFQGSYQQVAIQQASAAPLSMRVRVPAISQAIEEVVMIALAKDPDQRFGSIQAFATAFHEASLTDQPTLLITPNTVAANPLAQPTLVPPAPPGGYAAPPNPQPVLTPAVPWTPTPQPGLPPGYAPYGSGPATPNAYLIGQAPAAPAAPPPKAGVSRRSVLIGGVVGGLIGLAAAGGGLVFWIHSGNSPFTHMSNPTATPGPGNMATATAQATNAPIPAPATDYIYRGHSSNVLAASWSPNGKRIASASWDKTVQVWDALSGNNVYTYTGHTDQVETVAWSPNGQYIASGGKDNTVQVWDATSGALILTYTGHSGHVLGVAWSPDGGRIASASFDGTVRVWSVNGGDTLQVWMGHTGRVLCVAWSPDGQLVASGGYDHTVQVWNPVEGNGLYTYTGHSDDVTSVAWSPTSQRIASGSNDQTVQVWDARDGGHSFTYLGHAFLVYSVAWSRDGRYIASGSADTTAQVWDASNGGHAVTYRGHSSVVESVAWSNDNMHIASASDDKTVQVWTI